MIYAFVQNFFFFFFCSLFHNYQDLAHVSFEQLAEIKGKMGMKEFSNTTATKQTDKPKISKDQILKDLKGAAGKLKKTNKVKLTKEDMKRESKHR